MQEVFAVPEVHCGHCKQSIEGVLRPLEGVSDAVVDVDNKSVVVSFDASIVDRGAIVATIEEAGYRVA